jgi:succinate dehydrogenase / fumarate reductase cytochrome b subunit
MRERPLSPHLSVYRFKYTLTSSILNRFTGIALSTGLLLLVYWLMAAAGGARAYARAQQLLSFGVVKIVYAGLLFAFCYHLIAGIRHLIWDTGHGLERSQSQRSAWVVGVVSVALFAALGYWLVSGGIHAR